MNRPLRALALVSAIALSVPAACTAQSPVAANPIAPPPAAAPAAPLVTGLPDFTALVQKVGPAVVSVSAQSAPRRVARGQMPDEGDIPEIFRRFFGPEGMPMPGDPNGPRGPRRGSSLGTGFLISDDGYVLTNHHVVDGADEVSIRLSDRREFTAKVVGSDQATDVALLKIDAKGLPSLRVANASLTRAGQWVIAIGSPFGLEHSVTAGIVSAVGRSTGSGQQYVPFIQTDVAINQGNSGGPLLNTAGEVVGINSQIFSNSGGYMGVSFAIPIDLAMNAAEQLRATGRVSRGQLGVQVQQITADTARGLGLPDSRGALVADVVAGSPAEKAGIERMDVIRAFNGRPVDESSGLPPLVGAVAPGSRAKVSVIRAGKPIELDVVVGELDAPIASAPPAGSGNTAPAAPGRGNALGLVAQDLTAVERQRLGLASGEGVRLARITGDAAGEAGLQPGDVILAVGRNSVGTAAALDRALASVQPDQTVMLLIRRGNGTQFVAVTPDPQAG
ncbi:DegQ family serine endoprotease [Montanilutibacter psychrotolerans]|uniref:Probable periplasmic serine endoprotease DegP-like n=1 Tax=Montanilutibacter psychrotolerans TaxID=1327343 RepID=A0A3M8SUJ3_9GAMM|nr:DegQ family serine endoprotease [Lysobacter psychrotolerans]RNF84969.1 DegQ family serine endoprotease [Lysobacter psychrotolerans]